MLTKACVIYKGALAHYLVTLEHEGIYHAHLARYDGRVDHFPPLKFTLIKGPSKWTGSINDEGLLKNIGRIIDNKEKEQYPGNKGSGTQKWDQP
jgi:hypothetical protein